jgi:hypothetical protein
VGGILGEEKRYAPRVKDPIVSGTGGSPLRGRHEELLLIESCLDETPSGVGSAMIDPRLPTRVRSGSSRLKEAQAT